MQSSDVQPGQKFDSWTVIGPTWTERDSNGKRQKAFLCECSCGAIKVIRWQVLKKHKSSQCDSCAKKKRGRWNGLSSGHRGNIRPYDIWAGIKRRGICCDEWVDDFPAFLLHFYEVGRMTHPEFTRPNVPWNYFKVIRFDEDLPYGPGNLGISPFRTERAWDQHTYQYWWKLRGLGLLTEEMADSYISFINTFGVKQPFYLLSRHDITQPHTLQNSYWVCKKTMT